MEIKEFVSTTIIEIIEGVRIAQEHARQTGSVVNPGDKYANYGGNPDDPGQYTSPNPRLVEFEIFITTADSTQAKSGLQVFFPPFKPELSSQDHSAESTSNHIKFSIPITFPHQKSKP